MGKPQKRSPELEDKILKALTRGHSMRRAALLAGVSEGTVRGWRDKDPEFAERYERAIADRIEACLAVIWAGKPGWQSKGWILERLHPDEFSLRQRIDHANADGQAFTVTIETPHRTPGT